MPENHRDQIANALLDTQDQVHKSVEQGLERDPTMSKLSAAQERALFWQRAISPQEEAQLWAQGVDPWEISARVFPKRWQLMGMGRTTDTEKVQWLKGHADQGPPAAEPASDADTLTPAPLPSSLGTAGAPSEPPDPGYG